MNRSTPGLPVHHQLPESTQTHVHLVGDAIQPSHPLSSPSPPAFNLSQHQGLFQWVTSSHQVARIVFSKNIHNLINWELCFIWQGIFRTSSLGDSISSNPERTALRRLGDEPGYIEVLQQRAGSLNIKRLWLIKENQITQVQEPSAFPCMGRCKSLGSLKSFLSYASQLSGASILCFHIPNFLRAHHGEWL